MQNNEHLNEEGLVKIVSLKASLNNGLSEDLNTYFPVLRKEFRSKVDLPNHINYNWLAGFISGDGCFFVNILKVKDCNTGFSVKLSLNITQHSKDKNLLDKIVKTLKCGHVYNHSTNAVVVKVSSNVDILNIVIPLFKKFPIRGIKSLDFQDFSSIAWMIKHKIHLTWQGIKEIQKIKSTMNKSRN